VTKTEQRLLERIDSCPHKTTAIVDGYRTGRKRGSYGAREFNAMISLRDKGVVEIVKSDRFIDSRAAYSDHWSEVVIRRVPVS
jgi:hypothetical protein